MSFKAELWFGIFAKGNFPALPCPTCKTGYLREVTESFAQAEATYGVRQDLDDLPDDYIEQRFSMLARCTDQSCGEVVAIAGEYSYEEAETEHGWALEQALNIRGVHPAPPMIDLPSETPEAVKELLEKSFSLFWVDYGACVNAIRSAGEQMLNELGVPKKHRIKAKPATGSQPAKPAKIIDLDFNGRIQWLAKRNKTRAKIIDSLRKLGNLGSHGHDVTKYDVHKAMRIVDYVVSELFEKHAILATADEIIDQPKPVKKAKKKKR